MNKYKEALNILKIVLKPRLTWVTSLVINQYLLLMEELVEKATPKKPIYSDFEEVDDNVYVPNEAKCPTCGNEFKFGEFNDIVNHHCICGQKIDWEVEVQENV